MEEQKKLNFCKYYYENNEWCDDCDAPCNFEGNTWECDWL